MKPVISHTLTAAIAVGASLLIGNWNTERQVSEATNEVLSYLSSQAQVRIVDMNKLTSDMLKAGYSATEITRYIERLVRVAKAKGTTIIEASDTIVFPESAQLPLTSPERLREEADALGIEPTIEVGNLAQTYKESILKRQGQ